MNTTPHAAGASSSPAAVQASVDQTAKGRRTMWLLLAVTLAPVIAAYAAFYGWRPSGQSSHGKVVSPVVVLDWSGLRSVDGAELGPQMRGKWVMALNAPGVCDADCQQKLYYMRQVRTLQADKMEKVARLWVVPQVKADAGTLAHHAGLVVVESPELAAKIGPPGQIALIDPRGNLMMRFPQQPDPKGMVRDLQKLLKYSR